MAHARKNNLDADTVELLTASGQTVAEASNALDIMLSRTPLKSAKFSAVNSRSHLRPIKTALVTASGTIAALAAGFGISTKAVAHNRNNFIDCLRARFHTTNKDILSEGSLLGWLDVNVENIANDLDPGLNITPIPDNAK